MKMGIEKASIFSGGDINYRGSRIKISVMRGHEAYMAI
jgi:hypothetical protein